MMASRLHTGGSGQGAGIHDMMGLGGRCNRLSVLVLQNGSEDVLPVSYIAKRSEVRTSLAQLGQMAKTREKNRILKNREIDR